MGAPVTADEPVSFALSVGLRNHFVDPRVERSYREETDDTALRYVSYALPPTALVFLAVWWWDVQVNSEQASETLWIRVAIALILLALTPLAMARRDDLLVAANFVGYATTYGGFLLILLRLDALEVGIAAAAINYMVMPLTITRFWQVIAIASGWTAIAIAVVAIATGGPALDQAVTWLPAYTLYAVFAWWFIDLVRRRIHAADGELARERDRSEELLHNILPEQVATELKQADGRIAHRADAASVLFADVVGFTSFARANDPERVVTLLDDVFSRFDEIAIAHDAEKIKTLGDGYLVVAGLPEPLEGHAHACADIATAMHEVVEDFNARHGLDWSLRVGIHSGEVVAGVIGTHKFAYDVWGETVNLASRLEAAGKSGRTQVSTETATLLRSAWNVGRARTIDVKGHGPHRVHWLGERRNHQR